ncbi:MAG: cytochrome c3 family protein [Desulfobacteraceae bacterium]|nr:cytochrome c3 family protein [Desulfobacteraceae bacterium]
MTSKKHRMIMYGVAIQLFLIAIVCYAAFPIKTPEEPLRRMYNTNAGRVLFDHQAHASVKGYALNCLDCHHKHGDEEIPPVACGLCHPPLPQGATFPESCFDCHADASEIENPETMKRSDAFHKQCIGCHEEYGKGPKAGSENCSKCHIL